MKRPLIVKLLILYFLIAGSCAAMSWFAGNHLVQEQVTSIRADMLRRSLTEARDTAAALLMEERLPEENLLAWLGAIADANSADVRLISEDGRVVLCTSGPSPDTADGQIPGFNYARYDAVGDFFGLYQEDYLSVIIPVIYDFDVHGYLSASEPMREVLAIRDRILSAYWVFLFLIFAAILLFFLAYAEILRRPLGKVLDGVQQFTDGNFSYHIELTRRDELKLLADRLNLMADRLRLEEDRQREFLTNISHDIRSPLTIIKGFTDALADGTIPPELSRRYCGIIAGEVNRLDHITAEILTLGSLSESAHALIREDFDIHVLIRESANAFENACRKKHLRIRLLFCDEVLTVNADRNMIGLALRHLLDNAVKFSPEEGTIEIESSLEHGKCLIAVRDQGPGIPESEQARIWDRFYKGDNSRGLVKDSSGLGLPIVRKVMNAHGQTASVANVPGSGAEFTITLKPAP